MLTISVRTALDLYLQAKNFPRGSEVLLSAINIPDVVKIIRYHGLVPVPVDIESDTLEMKTDFLEESITERSCMILVAFLYGTWYDLSKIHEVAQKY